MTLFLECRIMSASWMALQALLLSHFQQLSWTVASNLCKSRYSCPSCVVWLIISTRSTVQTEPITQLLCLEVGNQFPPLQTEDLRRHSTLHLVTCKSSNWIQRLSLSKSVYKFWLSKCKLSARSMHTVALLDFQLLLILIQGDGKLSACRAEKCRSAYHRGCREICVHRQWALQLHLQGDLAHRKQFKLFLINSEGIFWNNHWSARSCFAEPWRTVLPASESSCNSNIKGFECQFRCNKITRSLSH